MLDVGQGDGLVIRGPEGKTYFMDGGSSDVKKVGEYRIEPYLLSQGIGSLDYVFASHGDKDHISGIKELVQRQKTDVYKRQSSISADSSMIARSSLLLKFRHWLIYFPATKGCSPADLAICALSFPCFTSSFT